MRNEEQTKCWWKFENRLELIFPLLFNFEKWIYKRQFSFSRAECVNFISLSNIWDNFESKRKWRRGVASSNFSTKFQAMRSKNFGVFPADPTNYVGRENVVKIWNYLRYDLEDWRNRKIFLIGWKKNWYSNEFRAFMENFR